MLLLAQTIVVYLLLSWLVQGLLLWLYSRAVRAALVGGEGTKSQATSALPRICVLMPLRGADPYLAAAIRSVITNSYPNLALRIVVDSRDDPAWPVVEKVVADLNASNVTVSTLKNRPPECSLICSSLIQAFDEAEKSCDLVTFCAADMVVPDDWYWHMARSMQDARVGSLLGNRWYMPPQARLGSLVRYAWNAGAVVLMWLFKIPWGGAVALRPADVHRSNLRRLWATGLVEDVPVYVAMRKLGLKMQFVPELTIVNYEETGLGGAFTFLKRQMMWARLYHPSWPVVVLHSLLGLATLVVPVVVAGWALAVGSTGIALGMIATVLGYLLGLSMLLVLLEGSVRKVLVARGEVKEPLKITQAAFLVPAIALTQLLYPVAAVACCFAREVAWRGIRYRIVRRGVVRMVEYVPFRPDLQPAGENISV